MDNTNIHKTINALCSDKPGARILRHAMWYLYYTEGVNWCDDSLTLISKYMILIVNDQT